MTTIVTTKDHNQIEIQEQLDNLKGLIGKIAAGNNPMDAVQATIVAELVQRRVLEYCLMQLTKGGGDGLDRAAA